MRLLLIRHAESEGNAENRFQGQRDFPLSVRGVEQALRLAARLKDRHIDHIYASPLSRADHTARIVAESIRLGKDFHNDTADQIIVATARHLGYPLITADEVIQDNKWVETVWN